MVTNFSSMETVEKLEDYMQNAHLRARVITNLGASVNKLQIRHDVAIVCISTYSIPLCTRNVSLYRHACLR